MNSSKDILPETVSAESPSSIRIAEKLPESMEMDRAFADSEGRDGKQDDGKAALNAAAGDQKAKMLDDRGANKSEHHQHASLNGQEEEDASKSNKESRNPITGFGLNGDGVGGVKPMRLKAREGNPLTGEGYKSGENKFLGRTNGEKNSRGSPPQDTLGPW